MRHQRSLKWQLLIGNTLIFSFLLTLFGIVVYFTIYNAIVVDIHTHNRHLVDMTDERVGHFIETPVAMVGEMRDHLQLPNGEINRPLVETYLNTLINVYPYIDEIKIVDAEGNIVDVAPSDTELYEINVAYEPFFLNRPLGNQINWSNVYLSPKTFNPTITVTANAGSYLIVEDLNLKQLGSVAKSDSFESLISVSILDQYGNYLIADDVKKVEQRLRHPEFDLIKKSVEDKKSLVPSQSDPNVLLTGAAIGESNQWYLVIAEDGSKLYSPLTGLTQAIFGAFIFIVMSSLLFLYLNLKKALRGLNQLSQSTHSISGGQYNFVIEPNEFFELQELADHFGIMAEKIGVRESEIHHLNENLEHMVEERTEQLITTNHILEEVNTQLEEEITERHRIEEELVIVNRTLEQRVAERTSQLELSNSYLEETNAQLEEEIEEHRKTVQLLEEKETALERAIQIAEGANLSKSQFLANMSHEIRTPMNGILGMIDVMVMTQLSSEQQAYLKAIRSSSDVLLTILNDILEYSKMEAGKVEIKHEPFNLKDTVHAVHHLFLPSARQKGIDLSVDIPEELPNYLLGDEKRLHQVLSNLVGNAVKFTSKGYVQLALQVLEKEHNCAKIRFAVKDTGIGISEDDQGHLFERFTQFSLHDGKKTSGTGLGLAISKMLMELMKGQIGAKSKLGQGSEFFVDVTFDIAKDYDKEKLQKLEDPGQRQNNLGGVKVLVAEDDATSLYMMKEILTRLNAEVHTAGDGLNAIKLLKESAFDLVLMDVNMPVMDGLTASRKIRELRILNRQEQIIPIIAMTAYAMFGDREKCIEAGMTDYLSKPVELNNLIHVINRYKKLADFQDEDAADELNIAATADDMDAQLVMNTINNLMKASGLSYESCQYLLATYVKHATEILKGLRQSLADDDSTEAAALLHKLKGASGNIRANSVMELVLKAEHAVKEGQMKELPSLLTQILELVSIYEKLVSTL